MLPHRDHLDALPAPQPHEPLCGKLSTCRVGSRGDRHRRRAKPDLVARRGDEAPVIVELKLRLPDEIGAPRPCRANQHGVREAKFPDTAGDFGHLSRRMRPRIPRVRDKILYLSILNSERFNSLSGCRRGSYARAQGGDIEFGKRRGGIEVVERPGERRRRHGIRPVGGGALAALIAVTRQRRPAG